MYDTKSLNREIIEPQDEINWYKSYAKNHRRIINELNKEYELWINQ